MNENISKDSSEKKKTEEALEEKSPFEEREEAGGQEEETGTEEAAESGPEKREEPSEGDEEAGRDALSVEENEDEGETAEAEEESSTGGEREEEKKAELKSALSEEEEKRKNMKWYVVHTYSGREKKVRETLQRLITNSGLEEKFGNIIVATEEVAEMKKGKKRVKKRKLFPSYIIIQMEMTNETWSLVENVPGVTHFVGGGEKPFPIPRRDVDRILGRMEKREGVIPEVPFTIGEHVNVVDGPFSDFTGIVDEISPERGKLKVLVSIFGRETPVELDFLQVKPL